MVDNQTISNEKEKWQRSEPLNIDKIHEMVEYAVKILQVSLHHRLK